MSKLHIKKGDVVVILSGEDAGKTGKVLQVLPKRGRAIVEGLNLVKRHTKKNPKNQQGGIIEKEASLPLGKLKVAEAKAEPKAKASKTSTGKTAAKKPAARKKTAAKEQ